MVLIDLLFHMFQDLLDGINCENPTEEDMAKLEMFICRLYKDRVASSLNTVRVRTFLTCNKPEEMPPTSNSAKYHILRTLSQAFVWRNAHVPYLEEESAELISKCFHLEDNKLVPIMTDQPALSDKVIKLVLCNCKTGCRNKTCVCRRVPINCFILCHAWGKSDIPCTNVATE